MQQPRSVARIHTDDLAFIDYPNATIPFDMLELAVDALAAKYELPNKQQQTLIITIDAKRDDYYAKRRLIVAALNGANLRWHRSTSWEDLGENATTDAA